MYKGTGLQRFQSKKIKEMLKEQEETKKEELKLSEEYNQLKELFEKNAPKLSGFKN